MSAATEHVELPITGMTCASCANRIERKLNTLDGVTATVNYATEKARVRFDPGTVAAEQLVGAVEAAGYSATLPSSQPAVADEQAGEQDAIAALRRRVLLAALLSVPALALSMIPALQFDNFQWLSLNLVDPRRPVGRLAVPQGGVGEPQARRRDDGHAGLARARSPPGCGRCTRCSSATRA